MEIGILIFVIIILLLRFTHYYNLIMVLIDSIEEYSNKYRAQSVNLKKMIYYNTKEKGYIKRLNFLLEARGYRIKKNE